MPGIIPNPENGGVVVRDAGGNCLAPANVSNAYCPSATFLSTCEIRYLTDEACVARIMPSQINAFQSELLCFAEFLDPDGTWNCDSPCNLSSAFNAWAAANVGGAQQGDGDTISTNAPFALIPSGAVEAICGDDGAADALAACLVSSAADNRLGTAPDGRLFVSPAASDAGDGETISASAPYAIIPAGVVEAICDDATAKAALGACMVSTDAGNNISQGSDGALFAPAAPAFDPDAAVTAICEDDTAADALAACLVSEDADNQLAQGADGGLFVPPVAIPPAPEGDGVTITTSAPYAVMPQGVVDAVCGDDAAADALASCLVSGFMNNALTTGPDGRLFAPRVLAGNLISDMDNNALVLEYDDLLYVPKPVGPFVLYGVHTVQYDDLVGIPATGGFIFIDNPNPPAFTIPNNSPLPIFVRLQQDVSLDFTISDAATRIPTLRFELRDTDNVNGTVLIQENFTLGNVDTIAGAPQQGRQIGRQYATYVAALEIPPGGRQVRSWGWVHCEFTGQGDAKNMHQRITWYGVSGTPAN